MKSILLLKGMHKILWYSRKLKIIWASVVSEKQIEYLKAWLSYVEKDRSQQVFDPNLAQADGLNDTFGSLPTQHHSCFVQHVIFIFVGFFYFTLQKL